MWFLPSRLQWRKWSLPSKLTAVGAYIGIVSIPLAIGLFALSIHFQARPTVERPPEPQLRSNPVNTQTYGLRDAHNNLVSPATDTQHATRLLGASQQSASTQRPVGVSAHAPNSHADKQPPERQRTPGQYFTRRAVARWEIERNQLIDMSLESIENDPESYLKFTFLCRNSSDRSVLLSLQPFGNLYADKRNILTMDPMASLTDDLGQRYSIMHDHPDDRLDLGNALVTIELFPHTESEFHLYFTPIKDLRPKAISLAGSFFLGLDKLPHPIRIPDIRLAFLR